jgi:hypothetical protein
VIEHGEPCPNLVQHDGIVFIINVGLHGVEEGVTEDGIGCRSFGQSNRDGGWASVDFILWEVVGDDRS